MLTIGIIIAAMADAQSKVQILFKQNLLHFTDIALRAKLLALPQASPFPPTS